MPEINSGDYSAAAENQAEVNATAGDDFWPDESEPETDDSTAEDATKLDEEPAIAGDFWF